MARVAVEWVNLAEVERPVRNVWGAGGVLVFLCALVATSWAVPEIDSVSGEWSQGGTVTISGSGLGTKTTPGPVKWDDFEGGSEGEPLQGWQFWKDNEVQPCYSTQVTRPGSRQSALCAYRGKHYRNCTFFSRTLGPTQQRVYLSGYYFYRHVGGAQSRNIKLWSVGDWPMTSSQAEIAIVQTELRSTTPAEGGSRAVVAYAVGGRGGQEKWTSATPDTWVRFEVHAVLGDVDQTNGTVQVWRTPAGRPTEVLLDACEVVNRRKKGTFLYQSFSLFCARNLEIGGVWRDVERDYEVYYDDIYIDATPARVELGNAPTWAECTLREVQLASAWSETAVTFSLHRGALPEGPAYLYVVDDDGVTNARGFPVSLGVERLAEADPE